MSGFKKFVLAAVLALGAMGSVAVIDSPVVGTSRADAQSGRYRVEYSIVVRGSNGWGTTLGPYTYDTYSNFQSAAATRNWINGMPANEFTYNGVRYRYWYQARIR